MAQALADHRTGRLGQAMAAYRLLIDAEPSHADAWHLLGLAEAHSGDFASGIERIKRAIDLKPNTAVFYNNLAKIYLDQNKYIDVIDAAKAVIRCDPKSADGYLLIGLALQQIQLIDGAVTYCELTTQRDPDLFDAYAVLATNHTSRKDLEKAVYSCRQAVRIRPTDGKLFDQIVTGFIRNNWHVEAIPFARRLIELHSSSALSQLKLASCLNAAFEYDQAEKYARVAISLDPNLSDAQSLLFCIFGNTNRWSEALEEYEKGLIMFGPTFRDPENHAAILAKLGRLEEAADVYRSAIDEQPNNLELRYRLSMSLLAVGAFEDGWGKYESRWAIPYPTFPGRHRDFPQARWVGRPLMGKRLLVHCEQGAGDSIQFIRYINKFAEDDQVIIEAPDNLVRLFQSSFPTRTIVAYGDELPKFDLQIPLLSVPAAFGMRSVSDIPGEVPYLQPTDESVQRWRARLDGALEPRIGIVWAGGAGTPTDHARSIPFKIFEGILTGVPATFVSLQKYLGKQPDALPPTVLDLTDELDDFDDTAGLIANLDLVISVDTATAHLAGALGKPILLLNRYHPCWRWLVNRTDSPWYPSLDQISQTKVGDWQSVIFRARSKLMQMS